jgi:peptidoglycan/LPS O-acetylase OafA/YrhL
MPVRIGRHGTDRIVRPAPTISCGNPPNRREREQKRVNAAYKHVIGIDIIRFCAALMVMLFHLAYWSWAPAATLTKSVTDGIARFPSLAPFVWPGWVGVEIFFVISGFVIAYSASGATPLAFLRSRILRLYPAAWVCATATLITVLLLGRGDGDTILQYTHAMTLWIYEPWIDGVYWTLGVEIAFYVAIFGVLCLGRYGSIPLALGLIALASAGFWWGLAIDRLFPGILPLGFLHDLLASPMSAFLLLRHGCFFALGGLLWLSQTRRLIPWLACLIALCLLTGALEISDSARPIVAWIGDSFGRRAMVYAVWLIAVACVAGAIFANDALHRRFGRSAGIVKTIGLMTYPVYLLHNIIGAALLKAGVLLGTPPLVALGLAMASVLLLGWLVTRFLEPPIRARLRQVLSPPSAVKPVAPSVEPTPSPSH